MFADDLSKREWFAPPPPPRDCEKTFFTIGELDNNDHNPSATTAKGSFHGTAISIVQHPTKENLGIDRSQTAIHESTL